MMMELKMPRSQISISPFSIAYYFLREKREETQNLCLPGHSFATGYFCQSSKTSLLLLLLLIPSCYLAIPTLSCHAVSCLVIKLITSVHVYWHPMYVRTVFLHALCAVLYPSLPYWCSSHYAIVEIPKKEINNRTHSHCHLAQYVSLAPLFHIETTTCFCCKPYSSYLTSIKTSLYKRYHTWVRIRVGI